MRGSILALLVLSFSPAAPANDLAKARLLEREGDSLGARHTLRQAAANDPEARLAYAEFLHRHRDPEARKAYEQLIAAAEGPRKAELLKRVILLSLVANDRETALKHYDSYKAAG